VVSKRGKLEEEYRNYKKLKSQIRKVRAGVGKLSFGVTSSNIHNKSGGSFLPPLNDHKKNIEGITPEEKSHIDQTKCSIES